MTKLKMRRSAVVFAALLLTLALSVTAFADDFTCGELAVEIASAQKTQAGIAEDAPLLAEEELFPAGSAVSDWTALAMARAGLPDDYAGYLSRLRDYVEAQYRENGGLHRVKATEYHRIALTAAALGGDPTAFGTKPDGTAIDLIADGTYRWQGEAELGAQGLNGWIFALLAMDATDEAVPEDALYSRQEILDRIISAQQDDGGFSLSGGGMDVDITAMALQALAPYQEAYGAAVSAALDALSAVQLDSGGFAGWNTENVESCAQVILALCALDIDPLDDPRFQKADGGVVDALLSFRLPDGSFAHEKGGQSDAMACEQVMQALAAMERQQQGEGRFFDLRDAQPVQSEMARTQALPVLPIVIAAVVLAAALAWTLRRKKEKNA